MCAFDFEDLASQAHSGIGRDEVVDLENQRRSFDELLALDPDEVLTDAEDEDYYDEEF